jgi:Uncharacterized conserved protein (DUF2075)
LIQLAYYSSSVQSFIAESPEFVLGILVEHHPFDLDVLQRNSWIPQIDVLQRELSELEGGWIAFEFAIPRMGKRVDNIVLFGGVVFVLEFKVGADQVTASAIDQATDYALDLKNFHAGSHDLPIVPIVIATTAVSRGSKIVWSADGVAQAVPSNGVALGALIEKVARDRHTGIDVDPAMWVTSGYKPTPTIIEAAQALYRGHRVDEITRSDAGAINLSQTADCIAQIIDEATAKKHKAICFVTGVPGAGKTLAGLNLVTQRTDVHKEEHAVFLSGNGPLVKVLHEALARDECDRSKNSDQKIRKADAERKIESFIQHIMHFRDDNLATSDPPIERVAVFDEAQRAWDSAHLAKFMAQKRGKANFDQSEPEFLMGIMDRHTDWCTVVCLVGVGQEINSGEAGLTEWFAALDRHFRHWKVHVSQQLGHRDYNWDRDLTAMLNGLDIEVRGPLHLSVSIRSFRAEKLSEFVGVLVAGEAENARALYEGIRRTYPIVLTRSLSTARRWLKARARGTERIGLVASSGAARLKPEGLNVRDKINPTFWFLNGKDDVRSSYYLEDPATEFDIQGLELDWVGVCWDADFRAVNGQWAHHKFTGTRWQNVKDRFRKLYLTNAYRVLLTRARQGIVVYVPNGDTNDATRQREFYDGTAEFLLRCGIETIECN